MIVTTKTCYLFYYNFFLLFAAGVDVILLVCEAIFKLHFLTW